MRLEAIWMRHYKHKFMNTSSHLGGLNHVEKVRSLKGAKYYNLTPDMAPIGSTSGIGFVPEEQPEVVVSGSA